MKSLGTPCKNCTYSDKLTIEQPCCDCISNEDIMLAHVNSEHPVDFSSFKPKGEE